MKARPAAWRLATGTSGVLLVLLAAGCTRHADPIGPSPVTSTGPRIIAVLHRDGLLLKAEHLENAQQIEGVVEWLPKSVYYESFDSGRWWFATTDWEWVIVPSEGRMVFGVWRDEPLSGEGVLGLIRFESQLSIEALTVWVDGRPVSVASEDRHTQRAENAADLLATNGSMRGAQGTRIDHSWFVVAAPSDRK